MVGSNGCSVQIAAPHETVFWKSGFVFPCNPSPSALFTTKIGDSYTRSRGITLSPRASVLVTLLRAVDFARFVRVLPLPGQTAEQIFFSALLSAAPCRLRPLCPLQFFLKNYDSANQDTYTGFQ